MENYFIKNQLLPCIVQSIDDGKVLMLGYMNKEALETTISSGFVTFYSRSRERLWTKGETSGNKIELASLYHDCDKDTFLAKGKELGPVCHTGARSCFDHGEMLPLKPPVSQELPASQTSSFEGVISTLFDRIEQRKKEPLEGSYTNYLFQQGVDKICKKIGEEGAEVIIAAKSENSEKELLNESADLIYHLLVLLSEKNLSLSQVYSVLKDRLKIQGNHH